MALVWKSNDRRRIDSSVQEYQWMTNNQKDKLQNEDGQQNQESKPNAPQSRPHDPKRI